MSGGKRRNLPTPQKSAAPQQSGPISPPQSQLVGVSVTRHSGPVPHPAILQGYENIKPGYADRIMGWTETEGIHRRGMERRQQTWDNWITLMALVLAFVVVIGFGGAGVWLLANGKSIAGLSALAAALVPVIGSVFVRKSSASGG